jgi:hypothetical protein
MIDAIITCMKSHKSEAEGVMASFIDSGSLQVPKVRINSCKIMCNL